MNTLLLANALLFSIHTLSEYDIPNTDAILQAAQQEIAEASQGQELANSYIIVVDPEADLDRVIDEVQGVTGGVITHIYRDSIHGFAIEVSPEYTEDDLYLDDAIQSVESDILIKPLDDDEYSRGEVTGFGYDTTTYLPQFLSSGINRMEVDLSQTARIDGGDDRLDVNIAIIDTGVDSRHPDLNVVYSKNFISSSKSGEDDNGHGTHVAGIAAGRDNSIGIVGVAPGANIYSLKVLNNNAWGYLSDIIQAVDWVTKQSKPTSSSSNSDSNEYADYMKKYEKSMKNYSKYLSRGDKYVSRVQQYLAQAQEYKVIAYQYLNGTPSSSDKNVLRMQRYQVQANEYKIIAYQYLNGNDVSNYEKYMGKYEKALQRVAKYQERIQKSLAKNYQKYWKKYEKSLSRASKYQSRIQGYVDRANGYLAEANEYKRIAQQFLTPTNQTQTARNPNKIDVVNMSIGATGKNTALHRAIQASVKEGVVYVVSAGNGRDDIYGGDRVFGTSDDNIPAAYPEVVAVSAMIDTDGRAGGHGPSDPWGAREDTIASFSNFSIKADPNNPVRSPGRGIDVAAPGVNILSSWAGGGYRRLTGTSMAAPHVAGAFALLIVKLGQDVNKDGLTNEQDVAILRQIVIDTAQPQSHWRSGNTMDPDPYHEWLIQVSSF